MSVKMVCWLFFLLMVIVDSLHGSVITYNDRQIWQTAITGVVNVDFEPLNAANTVNGLYAAGTTGYTILGVGPIALGEIILSGVGQNTAFGHTNVNELQVLAPTFQ